MKGQNGHEGFSVEHGAALLFAPSVCSVRKWQCHSGLFQPSSLHMCIGWAEARSTGIGCVERRDCYAGACSQRSCIRVMAGALTHRSRCQMRQRSILQSGSGGWAWVHRADPSVLQCGWGGDAPYERFACLHCTPG